MIMEEFFSDTELQNIFALARGVGVHYLNPVVQAFEEIVTSDADAKQIAHISGRLASLSLRYEYITPDMLIALEAAFYRLVLSPHKAQSHKAQWRDVALMAIMRVLTPPSPNLTRHLIYILERRVKRGAIDAKVFARIKRIYNELGGE